MRSTWRRVPYLVGGVLVYLFVAGAGVAALLAPSPALVEQGGALLTDVWAGLCLVGAVIGTFGVCSGRTLPDLIGSGVAASACFVWGVSLVLQAVATGIGTTYTAACAAGALSVVFTQHCVNLVRAPRE